MGLINEIFVFGSNLAGRHGKGAALYARQHFGATYGIGEGIQGRSYGIPTKDENLRSLSLEEIAQGIEKFIDYARRFPEYTFRVTPIGCGLAGYKREQIRPFFSGMPNNCYLSKEWDE